jgi:hypothetical protein
VCAALELLGREIVTITGYPAPKIFTTVTTKSPFHYVISRNLHRRHLTIEERREIAAKLLATNPEQSNRQVAKIVKLDHQTVAAVRSERESTGEIPQLKKTKGSDGKARPARVLSARPKLGTPVEKTIAYDFCKLRTAWHEVEAQAVAGNDTRLRMALQGLQTEVGHALKADRITIKPSGTS